MRKPGTRRRARPPAAPATRSTARLAQTVEDLALLVNDLKQRVSLFELEKRHKESVLGRAERGAVARVADEVFDRAKTRVSVSAETPFARSSESPPLPIVPPAYLRGGELRNAWCGAENAATMERCDRPAPHEGDHQNGRTWNTWPQKLADGGIPGSFAPGATDAGPMESPMESQPAYEAAGRHWAFNADDRRRREIIAAWEGDRARLCLEPPGDVSRCALGKDHKGDHVSVNGFAWHKWSSEE